MVVVTAPDVTFRAAQDYPRRLRDGVRYPETHDLEVYGPVNRDLPIIDGDSQVIGWVFGVF